MSSRMPELVSIQACLAQLKPELYRRWGITELAVFGSVSRGEATEHSDVDILFDYDKPLGLEIVTLGDFLEAQLGFRVDLLSRKAVREKVWPYIEADVRYV
jgi:uncharacterized protein